MGYAERQNRMQRQVDKGQVQIQVPVMLPVSEDFYITPTMLQLIVAIEVLPPRARRGSGGSLKVGDVHLKITLASGAVLELDCAQSDAFLIMLGVRQRLVEVASSLEA
jgi:hypothetical protein